MAATTAAPTEPVVTDAERAPLTESARNKDDDEFPPFPRLVLVMLAAYLSMFLVALVSHN